MILIIVFYCNPFNTVGYSLYQLASLHVVPSCLLHITPLAIVCSLNLLLPTRRPINCGHVRDGRRLCFEVETAKYSQQIQGKNKYGFSTQWSLNNILIMISLNLLFKCNFINRIWLFYINKVSDTVNIFSRFFTNSNTNILYVYICAFAVDQQN